MNLVVILIYTLLFLVFLLSYQGVLLFKAHKVRLFAQKKRVDKNQACYSWWWVLCYFLILVFIVLPLSSLTIVLFFLFEQNKVSTTLARTLGIWFYTGAFVNYFFITLLCTLEYFFHNSCYLIFCGDVLITLDYRIKRNQIVKWHQQKIKNVIFVKVKDQHVKVIITSTKIFWRIKTWYGDQNQEDK